MKRRGSDELVELILSKKKLIVAAVLFLIVTIVFSRVVIPAIVIGLLALVATFSTSYKRFVRIPPAVELVTLTTILVSLAYGPIIGAIYGAVITVTAELMTNALDVFIITFAPGRAMIGAIAPFVFGLLDGNIVTSVLALSIIYNAFSQPLYLFMADVEMRFKSIYFGFVNVGANFILGVILGVPLATLLGII